MNLRPGWLLASVVALACSGDTGVHSTWRVTYDTLGTGTVVAVNTPGEALRADWVLREDLRVGTVEGSGPTSFGGLRGISVLHGGGFAVLDGIAQELRTFDDSGAPANTYGGKGSGPGELDGAFGLMLHPSGDLWVPDSRNARMSVFDPDEGYQTSYPLALLSRGFIWAGAVTTTGSVWKPSISLGPGRPNVLRVYGEEMVLSDTLPLPEDPQVDPEDPPGAFFWRAGDGRSSGYVVVPFFPAGDLAIDPAEVMWSTSYGDPSYRIARWTPGGDTSLVVHVPLAPTAIPAAERDSAIEATRDRLRERGGANQDWTKVPTVRPAITTMLVSDAGELWVLTERLGQSVFDVFSHSGAHLRTVQNPLRLYRWIRPIVRGDDLWAVVTDDFDVQYVVRAAIEPRTPN